MSERQHVIQKDARLDVSRAGEAIARIDAPKREEILRDFDAFREYLGKRIAIGQSLGLGEEQLARVAEKVGDYLAEHEEPRNAEEQLLRELWRVGEPDERHKLAHMLVRLAGRE
ncbi:DUF3243 domain-containing protein [Cohnella nanjingensis]|uniref:DUF3243 domain-containing protein n=1 Tax=Cohnella nanjingensis TaxID=1387779 RepID=A0A7X0RWP5_9BACL|nr:DUF3243 domain-containing protein [Cohnella nanjingensis]MBB6674990.1 DUF3243 domain-containing protein [Cohnella nanjingensis]